MNRKEVYLVGGNKQWTQETVGKHCYKTDIKVYAENKQHQLNGKGRKTGKALGKYIISLYSSRISELVKVRDIKKLQQDIIRSSGINQLLHIPSKT